MYFLQTNSLPISRANVTKTGIFHISKMTKNEKL